MTVAVEPPGVSRVMQSAHQTRPNKYVAEYAGMVSKEGLSMPFGFDSPSERTPEGYLDHVARLTRRVVSRVTRRAALVCAALGCYGGVKLLFLNARDLQTMILTGGAVLCVLASFASSWTISGKLRAARLEPDNRGFLAIFFSTLLSPRFLLTDQSEILLGIYMAYLVIYRGFIYPFAGPEGFSIGGLGMGLVFLVAGGIILNGAWTFLVVDRAIEADGPQSFARVLADGAAEVQSLAEASVLKGPADP